MKTVKDVIHELVDFLETCGDVPVFITEENEPGKPLTPVKSVVALEAGITDSNIEFIDNNYDTICIISTSPAKEVLDRITKDL